MLTEIGRIFVDEYGIAASFEIVKKDDSIELDVEHCVLMDVEKDLIKAGIKPFVCPFLNIAAAAMRRHSGVKTAISKFEVDTENHRCSLCFKLI